MSDASVIQAGREGIVGRLSSDRLLREQEQRLRGSLGRLKRNYAWNMAIPAKVELAIHASAMKATQGERK